MAMHSMEANNRASYYRILCAKNIEGWEMKTGIYRVRRGLFGKSILQELNDTPSFNFGSVDAYARELIWFDVDYNDAPAVLKEKK